MTVAHRAIALLPSSSEQPTGGLEELNNIIQVATELSCNLYLATWPHDTSVTFVEQLRRLVDPAFQPFFRDIIPSPSVTLLESLRTPSESHVIAVLPAGSQISPAAWWEALFQLFEQSPLSACFFSGTAPIEPWSTFLNVHRNIPTEINALIREASGSEIFLIKTYLLSQLPPLTTLAGVRPSLSSLAKAILTEATTSGAMTVGPVRLSPHSDDGIVSPILLRGFGGRSGTTLLMRLLGTNEDILFDRSFPFEVRLFSYLYRCAQVAIANPSMATATPAALFAERDTDISLGPLPWETPLLDKSTFFLEALRSLWRSASDSFLTYRHSCGTDANTTSSSFYYAEKAAFSWIDLQAITFRAKVIQLFRDPRDVWLSVHDMAGRRPGVSFDMREGETRQEYLDWFTSMRRRDIVEHIPPPHDVLLVRYEDLIKDPIRQLTKLFTWLGLQIDASKIRAAMLADTMTAGHMTSPSSAESIERWRHTAENSDSTAIWNVLGDVASLLGYQPV